MSVRGKKPWEWASDQQKEDWWKEYRRLEEMGLLDDPDVTLPLELASASGWNNLVARIAGLEAALRSDTKEET